MYIYCKGIFYYKRASTEQRVITTIMHKVEWYFTDFIYIRNFSHCTGTLIVPVHCDVEY